MLMLEEKVAFITGAARGQGRAHALRLADEGADVIAVDICRQLDSVEYKMSTPEDLEETGRLVTEKGRRIVTCQADVRNFDEMKQALDKGLAELGRLDIVVANAGILPAVGEQAKTLQAWRDAVDVMLTGVYNTVEPAIPVLKEREDGGSIVIISSTAGLKGLGSGDAGSLGYIAAKHGVVGLMRAWANLLGPYRIRVNTVHPAGCNTPMVVNEAFANHVARVGDEATGGFKKVLPVQLIEPSDVAEAVAYLVSESGRYVTGQTLAVDAGFTVRV